MRESRTWPGAVRAGDPVVREPIQDLCLPPDLGWADFVATGGTLDADTYTEEATALVADLGRAYRGEPAPELRSRAERLLAWGPLHSTTHHPLPTDTLPDAEHLARVATDMCPDASSEAPDWIFGPWADGMDAREPSHRLALTTALVWHGFTERDDDGQTTFDRWSRTKEVPPPRERARMRAVAQAPVGIWEITALGADTVDVVDRVGFAPAWVPAGPIRYDPPGGVAGGPRVGGALVGRAVRLREGWVLTSAFAVPAVPDARRVSAWLTLEAVAGRLSKRARWREELLARRGAGLARAVHEWIWSARD